MQNVTDFFWVIVVSTVCGFVLGFEREIHHKPAGLKTVTLVIIGSSIFTFSSINLFEPLGDSRVAAQIVNGIGFLGAGVILRSELKVLGLTTAATLWISAAIGVLIGTKMFIHAILATIVVFAIINFLRFLEYKVVNKFIDFELYLFLNNQEEVMMVKSLIENLQMKLEEFEVYKDDRGLVLRIKVFSDATLFFENFIKELKRKNIKYSL